MQHRIRNAGIAALAVALCAHFAAADPFFMGIGQLPDGSRSVALSVSENGQVVAGYGYNADRFLEAARWTADDGMVGLGFLNADTPIRVSIASGISDDGNIIVGSSRYGYWWDDVEAFRWTPVEGMVGIGWIEEPTGFAYQSQAGGVSADGQMIVGFSGQLFGPSAPFLWTEVDGFLNLGELPGGQPVGRAVGLSSDGSVIAGTGQRRWERRAFVWTEALGISSIGVLPLYIDSDARAISADGNAVVGYCDGEEYSEAFRWMQQRGMIGLGFLSASDTYSDATSTDADGEIVVGGSGGRSGDAAFIWTEERGMMNLQDVLVNEIGLDLTGWTLTWANDITAHNRTIVGEGRNPGGQIEGWIAHLGSAFQAE